VHVKSILFYGTFALKLHGLAIRGNTYPTYFFKLAKIQNKAMRIITGSDWQENVKSLYQNCEILNLEKMLKFETEKIIHNHLQKRFPANFDSYFNTAVNTHNRCTRSSNLRIPLFKTKRIQQSIKYTGVKIWNAIPDKIRDHHLTKFKKEYKKQR